MVAMEKIIAFIFQNQLLVLIIVALLLLTIAEAGFHRGMKLFVAHDEKRKAQISGVHGAVLGMLGLLLGFTFSGCYAWQPEAVKPRSVAARESGADKRS